MISDFKVKCNYLSLTVFVEADFIEVSSRWLLSNVLVDNLHNKAVKPRNKIPQKLHT